MRKNKALLVIALGATLFGGALFAWSLPSSSQNHDRQLNADVAERASAQRTASIQLDFGDGNARTFNTLFSEGESLFTVLQRVAGENDIGFDYKEYGSLGMLVTKIGDKENGDNERYWQYWVNGKYAMVGVSFYGVRASDIIEWRFVETKL